ncbi:MAG: lamin tail domain-containing protein [Marinilabiliales bacterium]|nr:lamin tail domain-containing protein [Marinilabiliales bacterium]
MADPHPVVALPDAEYIEIFNRGTSSVSLAGYRLLFGDNLKILPSRPIGMGTTPTGW